MSLLDEIKEKSRAQFRPAAATGIAALRSLGVPEDALDFYRDSEPVQIAEIAKVRLRGIADILAENRDSCLSRMIWNLKMKK